MHPRIRHKRCLLYLLGLAGGSIVLRSGWVGVSEELGLQSRGVTVRADVHDWRVKTSRYGTSYDVLYTFSLNGGFQRFDCRDRLLPWRTGLWSSVPQEVWQKARQDAKIDVVYLPENPFVNRPQSEELPLNGPVGVTALGAILTASCAVGLLIEIRRCRSRWDESLIDHQSNDNKVPAFVFFLLALVFFGWLTTSAIANAVEDAGPMNVRNFQLNGLVATTGRWVVAGLMLFVTLAAAYVCGVLAFTRKRVIQDK
jgi:hypothetical protein